MSATSPRTDPATLREEPGFDAGDLTDTELNVKIGDAHRIVERRIGGEFDEETLTRAETLVAAHLLTPALTGATEGKQVKQVQQESASVTFAANEDLPLGIDSPFWQQASDLTDGKINHISGPGVVGVR